MYHCRPHRQWNGNKKNHRRTKKTNIVRAIVDGPHKTTAFQWKDNRSANVVSELVRMNRTNERKTDRRSISRNRRNRGRSGTVCNETTPFPPTLDRSVFGERTAHLKLIASKDLHRCHCEKIKHERVKWRTLHVPRCAKRTRYAKSVVRRTKWNK